jgi:hypothetical protein
MKEFFHQCLEDLEAKTGLRQLYWLQQNPDSERQVNIVLDSMVIVSKEFSYIPEEDQQRIISTMMIKDQEYDGLNSRVIYKWLAGHREHYWSLTQNDTKEIPQVKLTAEQQAKVDKIAKDYLQQLAAGGFKPNYGGLDEEIKRIQREDKDRAEKKQAIGRPSVYEDPRQVKIRDYVKAMGKWIHELPKKVYPIDGLHVPGDTEDEAREIYMMALSDDLQKTSQA